MNRKEIKILMIEDLKIAQIAAINLFAKLSCSIQVVANAAAALEKILLSRYDIIFIDIQLPDINGFELAQTIRNIEKRWTRLPLIAVTANFTEELENKSKNSGFDDFMIKPLTLENVRHILSKHLDKSRSNQGQLGAA